MHFFALHFVSFLVAVEHSSEIGRQWRVSYLARTGRDLSQRLLSSSYITLVVTNSVSSDYFSGQKLAPVQSH